jgi:hypothetical protein
MCAKKTKLIAVAPPGTEMILVDEYLSKAGATSLDRMERLVDPGVYKVRFIRGGVTKDVLVDATDPSKPVHVESGPMEFASAAPLEGTSTTHEYHMGPAVTVSRQTALKRGEGSSLFLFVRARQRLERFPAPNVVSVHDMQGNKVAGLEEGQFELENAWAALHIELTPGTYRLRVDGEGAGQFEMFITLVLGWQTQVFQMTEEFPAGEVLVCSPSLRSATVLMARMGQGFLPNRPDLRLAELARKALVRGRDIVSPAILESLLQGKQEDPILGLYAAHLLLARSRKNNREISLLNTVLRNLETWLPQHPDVQALRFGMGVISKEETLSTPPMLRASWDHVVHATKKVARVVPKGSWADIVAPNIVPSEAWLLFNVREHDQGSTSVMSNRPMAIKHLAGLLAYDQAELEAELQRLTIGDMRLSNLQLDMLRTVYNDVSFWSRADGLGALRSDSIKWAEHLFDQLPSPSGSTASAIMDLSQKLKSDDTGSLA